jgi:hypothetical protein
MNLHPLINKNSKHYDTGNKTTIEKLEDILTVREMIGACKFNIYKYEDRADFKGQKKEDLEKIKTYVDYLELLLTIDSMSSDFTVKKAFELNGLSFKYRAD